MPFPLVAKLALGGIGLYLVSSKKSGSTTGGSSTAPGGPYPIVPGPSSPSAPGAVPSPVNPATGQPTPIAQRMALVLGTGDPNAIRFEAGRLRQEGYPAQAAELEREAQKIDAAHAAAAHPAEKPPAPAPVVITSSSPGLPPVVAPAPVPPVIIQTPAGPVAMPQPAVVLPPAPVVIPTPAGPITLPSLPQMQLVPLPILAHGEVLSTVSPGQTVSEKTRMVQAKLASLGLMAASDVIGKYGPKTESAVKRFQQLANTYLKAFGKPVLLPTAGETVTAIKVDGKWGNQSNDMAALAHAPVGTGSTASLFGSFAAEPLPATPLPGIVPPMAPKPIDPRMALASRVAHNLSCTEPGSEDRSLLQIFQASEGLKPSGRYNASTGATLATRYGIVPPRPPCDWTDTHTKRSKQNYKRTLLELASKEPQRKEEWEQAARAVA